MPARLLKIRSVRSIAVLVALAGLIACSSQPETTTTTAPETTTTAPETTTTTPETTTTAPEAITTPSFEELEITFATTGRDVLPFLSETENSCLRESLGEDTYDEVFDQPLLATFINLDVARIIFQCTEPENLVVLGIALIDFQIGWTSDTRSCMFAVGRESPLAVLTGLGMVPPGQDVGPVETRPYALEFYNCMTPLEKVQYLARVQAALDVNTSAERDIIGVIPESEAVCVQEALADEEYAALLGATAVGAFTTSDSVSDCISEASYVPIFVSVIGSQTGGLSDNSEACITEFATEHPRYIALIDPTSLDLTLTSPADLVEIADNGIKMWKCFTDEELLRMEKVYTVALAA